MDKEKGSQFGYHFALLRALRVRLTGGYLATVLSHLRPNPRFAQTSDTRQPLYVMPEDNLNIHIHKGNLIRI